MANRNNADTLVPTTLPISSSRPKDPASAVAVPATPAAARITIVEWPMAKNKPAPIGRLPSCISLRVVLSIAAIWSASTA